MAAAKPHPKVKKTRPKKPSHHARQVLREMGAMVTDLRKWKAAGVPAREPITEAEVDRRIALLEQAEAVIRGEC